MIQVSHVCNAKGRKGRPGVTIPPPSIEALSTHSRRFLNVGEPNILYD